MLTCPAPSSAAEARGSEPRVSALPDAYPTSIFLIGEAAIQSHLRLDDTQRDAVGRIIAEAGGPLWASRDLPADRKARHWAELEAAVRRDVLRTLRPTQETRLAQILRQARGTLALNDDPVAHDLGLNVSQRERLARIIRESRQALHRLPETPPDAASSKRRESRLRALHEQRHRDLLAVLDARQRTAWARLLGPPFDFSRVGPLAIQAPELVDTGDWINTAPLKLADLRGRVVVVHFWTFGCINCQRNYPHYRRWHAAYRERPVSIIGIHSPELERERDVDNVRAAARENDLAFPVLIDNEMKNWNAWANGIWPSIYLVDKRGRVRSWWYGELNWDGARGDEHLEAAIEQLLAERPPTGDDGAAAAGASQPQAEADPQAREESADPAARSSR